jgi:hypothetical protein
VTPAKTATPAGQTAVVKTPAKTPAKLAKTPEVCEKAKK